MTTKKTYKMSAQSPRLMRSLSSRRRKISLAGSNTCHISSWRRIIQLSASQSQMASSISLSHRCSPSAMMSSQISNVKPDYGSKTKNQPPVGSTSTEKPASAPTRLFWRRANLPLRSMPRSDLDSNERKPSFYRLSIGLLMASFQKKSVTYYNVSSGSLTDSYCSILMSTYSTG